ncbi:MAG: hypothetical protein K5657_08760 [Desulfovibrio sp.]|nr:hypothetical protein [Desulfovibrio sp.]
MRLSAILSVILCLSFITATPSLSRPALSPTCQNLLDRMERTLREAAHSPLQGAWAGSNGRDSLVIIFSGNVCAMGMNNEELYGFWSSRGNSLKITLERNKSLNFSYTLHGDTLTLNNDIVLTRQSRGNRAPIPGFGDASQQGGRSMSASGEPQGPLDGTWECHTQQGKARFVFQGPRYTFFLNGRKIEGGTFSFKRGKIIYSITEGIGIGRRGEHFAKSSGDELIITSQNGTSMRFVRQ